MELKSLFLGLVFTIGIFAVKAGCGLSYVCRRKGRGSFALGMFCVGYLALFAACRHICTRIDATRCLGAFQSLAQSGMTVHVVMAGGLLVWGILLLRSGRERDGRSLGWLPLVIPCPVCGLVVFSTVAFLVSAFPSISFKVVSGVYLVFIAVSLLTIGVLALWGAVAEARSESILGLSMLFISAYFFLSALLMPQFSDLGAVYRLAAHSADQDPVKAGHLIVLFAIVLACFGGGFSFGLRQIRRKASCTSARS